MLEARLTTKTVKSIDEMRKSIKRNRDTDKVYEEVARARAYLTALWDQDVITFDERRALGTYVGCY